MYDTGLSEKDMEALERKEMERAFEAYAAAHDAERNGASPEDAKKIIASHLDGEDAILHAVKPMKQAKATFDFEEEDMPVLDEIFVNQKAPSKATSEEMEAFHAKGEPALKEGKVTAKALRRANAKIAELQERLVDANREKRGLQTRLNGYGREMMIFEQQVESLLTLTGQDRRILDQITQAHPQFGRLMDDRFTKLAKMEERLEQLAAAEEERRGRESQANQKAKLAKAMPDWEAVLTSADFQNWVQGQNAAIKRLVQSMDGDDVITVLELYKASHRVDPDRAEAEIRKKMRRTMQMNAATHVPNSHVGAQSSVPDDYAAAFDYYARKHDAERKKAL